MTEPHSAIGSLMHEHHLILRAVEDMRAEMERIAHEGEVDVEYVRTASDFLRTYADKCHHGKEEDILFRDLADKPMPPDLAREMQRLIDEHAWARGVNMRMAEAAERFVDGDPAAYREVAEHMGALADFYPGHIDREDHHFFKPAIDLFTAEERDSMAEQFEEFDRRLFHDRYRTIVSELEQRRAVLV